MINLYQNIITPNYTKGFTTVKLNTVPTCISARSTAAHDRDARGEFHVIALLKWKGRMRCRCRRRRRRGLRGSVQVSERWCCKVGRGEVHIDRVGGGGVRQPSLGSITVSLTCASTCARAAREAFELPSSTTAIYTHNASNTVNLSLATVPRQ